MQLYCIERLAKGQFAATLFATSDSRSILGVIRLVLEIFLDALLKQLLRWVLSTISPRKFTKMSSALSFLVR